MQIRSHPLELFERGLDLDHKGFVTPLRKADLLATMTSKMGERGRYR